MDGLRSRIAAALGEEPVEIVPEPAVVGSRFISPASGIAVAAVVAVVALLGLNQLSPTVDTTLGNAVAVDLGASYTEPTLLQIRANRPTERLLEYARRHDDSSYDFGLQ